MSFQEIQQKISTILPAGALLSGLLLLAPYVSAADEAKDAKKEAKKEEKIAPEQAEFFETKIRPLLADKCYSCHGEKKQKAKLRLDSKAAILKGSEFGPIIVDNDPGKSSLIKTVHYTGDVKMPPAGKLPDEEIKNLEAWVKMGAPWPGEAPVVEIGDELSPEQRKFWAWQPVRNFASPKVKNGGWTKNAIDTFILAKLEARGLVPNKIADKTTLIRRATFDLHGLPPTPQEVESFINDSTPQAYEKVVDRLLASPRYGEKWGRHWLDVARYADTKGYVFNEDRSYPNAFQYRDWVIRSFNEDLPYDQFITLQLAADRLDLPDEKRRDLAALGFFRVGRRFLNNQNDIIDDRIDTAMRGFQGLSVSCARCHDHKFDPIPTKDYYSLYGIFASSHEPPDRPISPKAISEPWQAHDDKVRNTENEKNNLIREQVKLLREREKKEEALPEEVKKNLAKFRERELPDGNELKAVEVAFEAGARDKIKSLTESVEQLKKSYPPSPERAMTLEDRDKPVEQRVFKRGNQGNQGDIAPRRFLAVLSAKERPEWKNGSGRLELAQAIASKENPLTARVMVNRLWANHFGAGIVRTPSDFGTRGEAPTHPELLDYLARRFMDDGWSLKKLHKLMMMSATYQQSSGFNAKSFAADPENMLLWRMNRRRLELEDLRDTLMAASGQLDTKIGGPSVDLWATPYTPRRAVYGQIERQNLPGIFKTFDFATPDASSPQRFRTVVPQQALFMMNNELVIQQARQLMERPEIKNAKDDAARMRVLYQILFARAPQADEITLGQKYLQSVTTLKAPQPEEQKWLYGYGAYDEATKRVSSFNKLTFFKESAYRGGDALPDPKIGWVILNAGGGHPGGRPDLSTIRRWVAPQDGTISISGKASHDIEAGDGVEMRIVSSRDGLLGSWTVQKTKTDTKVEKATVKKGDTIDFVVSCRTNENSDSYGWQVIIGLEKGPTFDSQGQFNAPEKAKSVTPLTAWARYAQALMMSNEFYFVD